MSWGIAANWLAVLGLIVLTYGTGAQAWADLAEFKSLRETISQEASEALGWIELEDQWLDPLTDRLGRLAVPMLLVKAAIRRIRILRARLAGKTIPGAVILMPRKLSQLRAKGGDQAVDMVRLIRSAEVWAIIMAGSALTLVAACIQLALA